MTSPPRHIGVVELSLLMIVTLATMVIAVAATIAANDDRSPISDAAPPATTTATARPATSTTPVTATTTAPTTTTPPTTAAPVTAAPATTVRRTTTTTLPPPPVYRLAEFEGFNVRFNPCQNPITIRFNPAGYLSDDDLGAVEEFLVLQATELSGLTGMSIIYGGLTDEVARDVYKSGEKILIHIGRPGEGLIDQEDGAYLMSTFLSWDRKSGLFAETDSFQATLNANLISDTLAPMNMRGRSVLMRLLGKALGLDFLEQDAMLAAGVNLPMGNREVMYWPSTRTEWGPGDRIGLSLVGADNPCF